MLDAVEIVTSTSTVEIIGSAGTVEVVNQTVSAVEVIATAPAGGFGYLTQIVSETSLGTGSTLVLTNLPTTYARLYVIISRARSASQYSVLIDMSDNNGVSYADSVYFTLTDLFANDYMSASAWIDAANGASARKGITPSGRSPYLTDSALGPINALRVNTYGPNFTAGTVSVYGMSLS